VLVLMKTALLDAFGYLGFVATFGFLFAYILVSVASPVYLKRRGERTGTATVMSVLAVAMLAVATGGSVYLNLSAPYNVLPYIFLGALGLGVLRFIYLKFTQRAVIAAIERDLESGFTP